MKKNKKTQDALFLKNEGDQWFKRNEKALGKAKFEPVSYLLDLYSLRPKSIIDIGCSDGWRLERLRKKYGAHCVGVDASKLAIRNGQKKYPKLDLKKSSVSDIHIKDSKFDLAIIIFVFHWISRETLMQSLSEIDRMIKPGGYLIIGDFAPDAPTKNKYHHLPKDDVWTYKDFYPEMFTKTGAYYEVARFTNGYPHLTFIADAPAENRAVFCLLRKNTN